MNNLGLVILQDLLKALSINTGVWLVGNKSVHPQLKIQTQESI